MQTPDEAMILRNRIGTAGLDFRSVYQAVGVKRETDATPQQILQIEELIERGTEVSPEGREGATASFRLTVEDGKWVVHTAVPPQPGMEVDFHYLPICAPEGREEEEEIARQCRIADRLRAEASSPALSDCANCGAEPELQWVCENCGNRVAADDGLNLSNAHGAAEVSPRRNRFVVRRTEEGLQATFEDAPAEVSPEGREGPWSAWCAKFGLEVTPLITNVWNAALASVAEASSPARDPDAFVVCAVPAHEIEKGDVVVTASALGSVRKTVFSIIDGGEEGICLNFTDADALRLSIRDSLVLRVRRPALSDEQGLRANPESETNAEMQMRILREARERGRDGR